MGVDWCVVRSTLQVLVLSVWNVEVGLGVMELLGKTKSCNIDLVTTLSNAHQEVIWLDVTMYEVVKYKPGAAPASLKQPSMAYRSKIDPAQLNQQVRVQVPDKTLCQ